MNVATLFASLSTPSSAPAGTGGAITRGDKATERDKAKLDEARAALQALKQRPPSAAAEERKAMARKKVDQLKARIRMLQMSASTDPKAMARMAAQLARELGAAVKAYAAAGGSTRDLGATPAVAPASADAPADKTAEEATQAAGTAEEASAEADAQTSGDPDSDGASTTADPYRKLIDEVNARGAEMARSGLENKADREFMTEAKGLANALKAALRQAQNRAEDDGASPSERRDGDKAMADLDKEIAEAGKVLTPGVSLTV